MRAKNRPSAFSDAEFRGTIIQERYVLLHVVAGTVTEARYTDVVAVVPPAPTVVVVSRTDDSFGVKVRLLVEAQFRQCENGANRRRRASGRLCFLPEPDHELVNVVQIGWVNKNWQNIRSRPIKKNEGEKKKREMKNQSRHSIGIRSNSFVVQK
jgi:hypothetical protein